MGSDTLVARTTRREKKGVGRLTLLMNAYTKCAYVESRSGGKSPVDARKNYKHRSGIASGAFTNDE